MELSEQTSFIACMGLEPKVVVPLSRPAPRVIAELDVPELWRGAALRAGNVPMGGGS